MLWLVVVLFLSVLLHEFGHAFAAWTGGYRVTSLGIGSGKPVLLARLPRSGMILYLCRFGLRFSGVTWVFFPKGVPSRLSDLLLACGGALANAVAALAAGSALAAFESRPVPFLTVWVPVVVVLLVNSILALSFFVPHRTLSTEQGALTSDGLHVLATLFPSRFRSRPPGSIAPPLRALLQKRAFWESIGDSTMLCVALVRAAEAYKEIGDDDAARDCWREFSSLPVMPGAEMYQTAWSQLFAARLDKTIDAGTALVEAERCFQADGNRAGVLMAKRERLIRTDGRSASDQDLSLAALQAEATVCREPSLSLSLMADRIAVQARHALRKVKGGAEIRLERTTLDRLISQYDAARIELESSAPDIRVYEALADLRAVLGDDGGAAIAYERALSAARRVFVALGFDPEVQQRFAARQTPLVTAAMNCSRRLKRDTDAVRYAQLLA